MCLCLIFPAMYCKLTPEKDVNMYYLMLTTVVQNNQHLCFSIKLEYAQLSLIKLLYVQYAETRTSHIK